MGPCPLLSPLRATQDSPPQALTFTSVPEDVPSKPFLLQASLKNTAFPTPNHSPLIFLSPQMLLGIAGPTLIPLAGFLLRFMLVLCLHMYLLRYSPLAECTDLEGTAPWHLHTPGHCQPAQHSERFPTPERAPRPPIIGGLRCTLEPAFLLSLVLLSATFTHALGCPISVFFPAAQGRPVRVRPQSCHAHPCACLLGAACPHFSQTWPSGYTAGQRGGYVSFCVTINLPLASLRSDVH